MKKSNILWLTLLLSIHQAEAATPNETPNTPVLASFKPIAIAELWASYSYGETNNMQSSAPQLDVHFRRLKFGAKGMALNRFSYHLLLHADRLGENPYASTKNSCKGLGLWHALISARLSPHSDAVNLLAGYYNIAVSRSSYSACTALGTLDKAQTDWYLRHFLTGKANGIESGIGIAAYTNFEHMHLDYRSSIFMPQLYQHPDGNSLLYTGRITVGSGKKSQFKAHVKHKNWVNQKRIEWALGGAYEQDGYINDSVLFNTSAAWGSDIHLHHQGFILEASLYQLYRNAPKTPDFRATLWHIKALYNFKVKAQDLEACLSHQNYAAEGNKMLYKAIGEDKTVDIGINWYINKDKVKMTLHYINQAGSASQNNGDYIASSLMLVF